MKIPKELAQLLTEIKGEKKKKPKTGFLGSQSKAYEEAEDALEAHEKEIEQ